jgi:hypothetical protein
MIHHAHQQRAYALGLPCTKSTWFGCQIVSETPVIRSMHVVLFSVMHATYCAGSGIAGLYLAVQNKLDVESTLQDYGLLSSEYSVPLFHRLRTVYRDAKG